MMLLAGLVIGLLLGAATGVAATVLFQKRRRGDDSRWQRLRRRSGDSRLPRLRRRAGASRLPRLRRRGGDPARVVRELPAPADHGEETTLTEPRKRPDDWASERTVAHESWDRYADVPTLPLATPAPVATALERTVSDEPLATVVAFHSGANPPVYVSVPDHGTTVGVSDELADGMNAPVHLQVAGDVVWASVQEPTPGLVLRHGDAETPLSPVPMPLRVDSLVVSGAWSFGLDTSSGNPHVAGTFTSKPVPTTDSLRVAVVLDCCALALERSSAADMVALAYVPSTASPLEDAVNRARKHASYLPGLDGEWDVLLVTGPDAAETTLGNPGLTTAILRSEVTRPRQPGRTGRPPALFDGDQVLVSAASEFPAEPVQERTFTWRQHEPVPALLDDLTW